MINTLVYLTSNCYTVALQLEWVAISNSQQRICLQCRRPRLIPGLGRSPGEGNGNPLQCSCLENPTDGGAWRATVHRGAQVRQDLATKPLPLLPKSDYFRKILDIQRKLKLMYSMVIQNIKQTEMEHESITCSSHEVH